MDQKFKPRIIGLTASPSRNHNHQKIQSDINIISSLIEGRIFMPLRYEQDLATMTNMSNLIFISTNPQPGETEFVKALNILFQTFLVELAPKTLRYHLELKQHIVDEYRALFSRITQEPGVHKNQRRFNLADLFQRIINSLEIMTVIGIEAAAKQISEYIHKLVGHEPSKNKVWERNDYVVFDKFDRIIKTLKGRSEKYYKLITILENAISIGNRNYFLLN